MSLKLRIILFVIGWLFSRFFSFLAYLSDFLAMFQSVVEDDGYYHFAVWKFRKTKRNKFLLLISLFLFFTVILAGLCFGTM